MAAGVLPKPGTQYGPCESDCVHVDCKCTRDMAAAYCFYCGKPVGYQTRFYQSGPLQLQPSGLVPGNHLDTNLVHANCHEDAAELVHQVRRRRPVEHPTLTLAKELDAGQRSELDRLRDGRAGGDPSSICGLRELGLQDDELGVTDLGRDVLVLLDLPWQDREKIGLTWRR